MNFPPVLFGIETEIGVTRDDDPELDVAPTAAERRQKVAHSVSCGLRCAESMSPGGATELHLSTSGEFSAAPPALSPCRMNLPAVSFGIETEIVITLDDDPRWEVAN